MRRISVVLISICFLLFLTACGQGEESIEQENTEQEKDVVEKAEDSSEEEPTFIEEKVADGFVVHIDWQVIEDNQDGVLSLSFSRLATVSTYEDQLMTSLVESDSTSNQVLSELKEISIEDETVAILVFSEDEMLTSMASSEHKYFTEMLFMISSIYGIEELRFQVEDEPGIVFGQIGTLETLAVEKIGNRGYYLITADQQEDATPYYVSGKSAGEPIGYDDNAYYDFVETLEKMQTVDEDAAFYQTAIPASINIENAVVVGNQAEVTIKHEEALGVADLLQFENVVQLAALDFQIEELRIVNESEQIIKIFSLRNDS